MLLQIKITETAWNPQAAGEVTNKRYSSGRHWPKIKMMKGIVLQKFVYRWTMHFSTQDHLVCRQGHGLAVHVFGSKCTASWSFIDNLPHCPRCCPNFSKFQRARGLKRKWFSLVKALTFCFWLMPLDRLLACAQKFHSRNMELGDSQDRAGYDWVYDF